MTGITAFALNNPRFVILFQVCILIAGLFAFANYPKREDPSITIREAVVTASFPGMSTARVEDLITRKLEEKIREIPEVKEIKSDSKAGLSIVHVVVKDQYSKLAPIWQKLRNKMDEARSDLPQGTNGPTVNDERGLTAIATVALWADGFTLAEMRDIARKTRDRLYALDGIKKIELFGVQEERIYLEISNTRMAQLGISPATIVQTLQAQNIVLPGGRLDIEGQNIFIEPSGNFNDVAAIKSVLIPVPGTDKVVPLTDIARIQRGYVDPAKAPVLFNGRPAIMLSVSISDGVDSVAFGRRLTSRIAEIEGRLPFGYFLEYATYQPDLVEKAVNGAVTNVYQSLVIVLAVVILFLGLRTGLIVGSFVPLAMLMGLVIMRALDIEFQRMSIASLVIALGMLVDNGIVVAEDIRSRLEAGEQRRDAVLRSGRSLAVPLLIASLTTILAFLPIPLAVGATGEYTLSLGQVVIIVLLSSWFLAMFSTTSLCFWLMKAPPAKEAVTDPYGSHFYRRYRVGLEWMLHHRFTVLGLTVLALLAAGFASRLVVKEFFPPGDRNQFLVYLDLPAGTRVDRTLDATEELALWLRDRKSNPEVVSSIAYIGSGGPRFFLSLSPLDPDPHVAFMVVNTKSNKEVPAMVRRVRQYATDHLPGVRARVKPMWLGGTESGVVEVRLTGTDADILVTKAKQLLDRLRKIPGTLDIKHDWENKILKVEVLVDQARARRTGVTSQEVAASLNTYIDGAEITDYREGDKTIPLVLRGLEAERSQITLLRDIYVHSAQSGKSWPLSQIATFRASWEFSRIKRLDQERTVTISAKHQFLKAGQLFARVEPALAALDLPSGYRWDVGGELEKSVEAQGYLFANMPLCFLGIVILPVWQFNSFRRAAIILTTIPLTLIGAVIGLLAMNGVFSFMVILGFLSLAGIIINNGIVLIDRIDIEREAGRDSYDAVVSACLARFRPILMTTLTTILGLLPLIVWVDPLFYDMATVIAFGLAFGTVFTLGVVPVLYTLLFRISAPKPATAA